MDKIARSSCRAFTLLEMMVVVVIASVIAVSVIPALSRMDDARRGAAVSEVSRLLEFARARAMASGRPTGVRFSRTGSIVTLHVVETDGSVSEMISPLGTESEPMDLSGKFGAVLERVSVPAPVVSGTVADTSTVWFDHTGEPQSRSTSGVLVGDLTSDASIVLEDAGSIVVRARSGLVEVP